jgi:hypothetical protein
MCRYNEASLHRIPALIEEKTSRFNIMAEECIFSSRKKLFFFSHEVMKERQMLCKQFVHRASLPPSGDTKIKRETFSITKLKCFQISFL